MINWFAGFVAGVSTVALLITFMVSRAKKRRSADGQVGPRVTCYLTTGVIVTEGEQDVPTRVDVSYAGKDGIILIQKGFDPLKEARQLVDEARAFEVLINKDWESNACKQCLKCLLVSTKMTTLVAQLTVTAKALRPSIPASELQEVMRTLKILHKEFKLMAENPTGPANKETTVAPRGQSQFDN